MDKIKLKDIILKTLEKEGGAAGLKALAKAAKTSKGKLKKDLNKMSGVKQHQDGDYISTPINEDEVSFDWQKRNLKQAIDKEPIDPDMYQDDTEGEEKNESLRNWFKKEDWVRIDTQGNIAGKCGTMKKGKAKTRCLPRAKAQSLTKAQRKATVAKKVRGSKKGKQFVKNTKAAKVSFKKKK